MISATTRSAAQDPDRLPSLPSGPGPHAIRASDGFPITTNHPLPAWGTGMGMQRVAPTSDQYPGLFVLCEHVSHGGTQPGHPDPVGHRGTGWSGRGQHRTTPSIAISTPSPDGALGPEIESEVTPND
jgi:hypothetical protein